MSNTQATKQALSEHKVIPDVLPDNINLSYNLTLEWPNAKLDKPGKELENHDTKPEPKVFINPAVSTSKLSHLAPPTNPTSSLQSR
jgi:hypothetical protein